MKYLISLPQVSSLSQEKRSTNLLLSSYLSLEIVQDIARQMRLQCLQKLFLTRPASAETTDDQANAFFFGSGDRIFPDLISKTFCLRKFYELSTAFISSEQRKFVFFCGKTCYLLSRWQHQTAQKSKVFFISR